MREWFFILLLGLAGSSAFAQKDVPVDELIKRAEAAPIRAQPPLYMEIASRQLEAADQLFSSGDSEKAQSDVKDVVTYADKAVSAAKQSGSHLKNVEIGLRKAADKLRAMQRTLAFDDQKPVSDAADRMESLRTEILSRMFSKRKGKSQ